MAGRGRSVGKRERGERVGELVAPVGPESFPLGSGQHLRLPAHVVGVLDGESRKLNGNPGTLGRHDLAELVEQDGDRPEVTDNMMNRQGGDNAPGATEENKAVRKSGPVSRSNGRSASSVSRRWMAASSQFEDVLDEEGNGCRFVNPLDGAAIHFGEGGPSAAWRSTSRWRLRRSTATSTSTGTRAAPAMLLGCARGIQAVQVPEGSLAERERMLDDCLGAGFAESPRCSCKRRGSLPTLLPSPPRAIAWSASSVMVGPVMRLVSGRVVPRSASTPPFNSMAISESNPRVFSGRAGSIRSGSRWSTPATRSRK